MRSVPLRSHAAWPVRAPVRDEIGGGAVAGGAGKGDECPLGIEQEMEENVAHRPARAPARPGEALVGQPRDRSAHRPVGLTQSAEGALTVDAVHGARGEAAAMGRRRRGHRPG